MSTDTQLLFVRSRLCALARAITRTRADEDGQGLTEYALILGLIAIIAIAALTLLGGAVTNALSTVANSV
jgi:pilus assembly protein Flp/PilA